MKKILNSEKMKRDGVGRNVYHFGLQKLTKGNIHKDKSKVIPRKQKYKKRED